MANKVEIDPNAFNRIIGGTEIKGDIDTKDDMRFDGKLTGNLKTAGKVIIGQSGVIKGEVTCKNAEVSGRIDGKIVVAEQLTLKSSSVINGDIITNKLAIEPGSKFTGTCSMESNISTGHATKQEEKSGK